MAMNRVTSGLVALFATFVAPFATALDAPCSTLAVSEPTFKVVIGVIGRAPMEFDGEIGTRDRFTINLNWSSFVVLSHDGKQIAVWTEDYKPHCIELALAQ